MSTKTSTKKEETPKKVPVRFNSPSDFGEKWVGQSPNDIDPKYDSDLQEKLSEKNVFDIELGIFGYLELQGEYKGKQHPFVIITCATPEKVDKPFTIVSSGSVIIKKLRRIGENNGFPILGKFVLPEGKSYFDLVDC